jgi:Na+-translocating ferredoxin:NAD+ oxidoreductase RNF subunit RnfB
METCVYCHGNGGKGTSEGHKMGVPDFTDAGWQSSKTDEQLIKFLEANEKGCTKCRGRVSESAIQKLVNIVRAFGAK